MTAPVLPREPGPVPPLVVDPARIRDFAVDLLAASALLDDLGGFVGSGARIGDWDGLGSAAYDGAIRRLGATADAMSLALRAVGRRVEQHADEMGRLAERRLGLLEERRHLVDRAATLALQAHGVPASLVETLVPELAEHAGTVCAFEAELERWAAALAAEEQEMRAVLARVLTAEQVAQHYAGCADPADPALATAPPPGAAPEDVRDWWGGLVRSQQLALVAAAPGAIGNRGGVPAWARDAANTVALERDLAVWQARDAAGLLTPDEERWLENARAAREARAVIADGRDPDTAAPLTSQLYAYQPTAFGGDGAVALAAGDVGRADDVSLVVPGFGTDASSVAGLAVRAVSLVVAARTLDRRRTSASMLWIGYDAPDNLPVAGGGWDAAGVATESLATRGGDRLAAAVRGLRAADGPSGAGRAHLTVVGHSYGSTTVGHAAHDHDLEADDLVVVGSPGLGGDTDHAADLGLSPDHVWVGANSRDPVANLGNHGAVHLELLGGAGLGDDPAEDDFGAQRFRAESTTRADNDGLGALGDHSKYFDPDTESLYDIGEVVTGHYDRVLRADPVTDPWYADPRDPEWDRVPATTDTVGQLAQSPPRVLRGTASSRP